MEDAVDAAFIDHARSCWRNCGQRRGFSQHHLPDVLNTCIHHIVSLLPQLMLIALFLLVMLLLKTMDFDVEGVAVELNPAQAPFCP